MWCLARSTLLILSGFKASWHIWGKDCHDQCPNVISSCTILEHNPLPIINILTRQSLNILPEAGKIYQNALWQTPQNRLCRVVYAPAQFESNRRFMFFNEAWIWWFLNLTVKAVIGACDARADQILYRPNKHLVSIRVAVHLTNRSAIEYGKDLQRTCRAYEM